MPKVLVVSRCFPPLGSVGSSIRIAKLIKYATQSRWSFTVLTQDPDYPVVPEKKLSTILLDELPSDLRIERIPNPFFNRKGLIGGLSKLFGNSSLPWGFNVIRAGRKLLHLHSVDLIFANTPPFTNVFVGAVLAKLFNIPFVIDMKDDWVGSSRYLTKNRVRRYIEAQIEKALIRLARQVWIVTQSSYEVYTRRYAALNRDDKFQLIPNGTDLDEYTCLKNRERRIETDRFTLLTAAAGYRSDYRDLGPLLDGVEIFLKNNPQARSNFEIVFLGEEPGPEYFEHIKRLNLESNLRRLGSVGRQELVEWLWKADLFFLVQPAGNATAISGTLYEYWATGKAPILLISEEGASSRFVKDHQIGEHFLFDQSQAVATYLEKNYRRYSESIPIWVDRSGVEKFDRKILAEQMLVSWDRVLREAQS